MAARVVTFRIDDKVRQKALKVLKSMDMTESEFLRDAMTYVAQKKELPIKKEYVTIPLIGKTGDSVETLAKNRAHWDVKRYLELEGVLEPKIIIATDDALAPEIKNNDLLGCDMEVREFKGDGFYLTEPLPQHKKLVTNGSSIAKITKKGRGKYVYLFDVKEPIEMKSLSNVKILGKVLKIETPSFP